MRREHFVGRTYISDPGSVAWIDRTGRRPTRRPDHTRGQPPARLRQRGRAALTDEGAQMRRIGIVAALAAAGLALAACSSGTSGNSGTGTKASGQGEGFTWWAAGSEKLGLDAMVGVFNKQHPDVKFINGAVAGGAGSAAKDLLQTRLQAKNPPDTFQAHAGKELTDYIDAGQIEDVSALYDKFGIRDVFPADLLKLLTVDGKIYSVPSNIHRSNMVWANPSVLTAPGTTPRCCR